VDQQNSDNRLPGQLWKVIPAGTHDGRPTYLFKNKGASENLKLEMVLAADHIGLDAPVSVKKKADSDSNQRWFVRYVKG
jgi:hypothetical protein